MRRGLRHGAPVVPAFKRAEDAIKANPGKSNVQIAEIAGVDEKTVRNAKKSGSDNSERDERPTIDNPPKGAPWDDRDDAEAKSFRVTATRHFPVRRLGHGFAMLIDPAIRPVRGGRLPGGYSLIRRDARDGATDSEFPPVLWSDLDRSPVGHPRVLA
jgi:hypothetical protein